MEAAHPTSYDSDGLVNTKTAHDHAHFFQVCMYTGQQVCEHCNMDIDIRRTL
jgi:hypothetical protein